MMAGATTHPFSTTTTSTHDWQFPPLPDEVLLHIFDYLDLQATMAVMRVSTHWHELANDPRVWKRLCCEQGFPKVDRRRFGCDWKRWYRCMVGRIKVHAFLGDYVGRPRRNEYSPITVLVEPDATVLTLVRVIACSSMVPPHKIRLWRIDDFEGDKLVLLQDPTQRLCDAGITSETADVLFELPDARNGYLRRLQPAATSSSGGPTHVPTNPPQDRIQLDDILRETELLTRFWNDHLSLHDARVYFGNHAAAAAAPMDADDDDDDEQLQRVLAVSMFEMERRND